jgi:hypothetical protein
MLAPSKITPIIESIFYKASTLGGRLDSDVHLIELYEKVRRDFGSLPDFIEALELLYVLGRIDFNDQNGVIKIA